MSNYYETLELGQNASTDEIRQAYRKLALRWHPDKNSNQVEESTRKFKEISQAYEILSDPGRRQAYDMDLGLGHSSSPQPRDNSSRGGNDFVFRTAEEVFTEFFGKAFGNGGFTFDGIVSATFGNNGMERWISKILGENVSISYAYSGQSAGVTTQTKTMISDGFKTTQVYQNGRIISETKVKLN